MGVPNVHTVIQSHPSWAGCDWVCQNTYNLNHILFFFLLMHDSILLACYVTVKWSDTLEIGYPYVHSQYSTVLLPTVFCVQCMREMALVLGFNRSISDLRASRVGLWFRDLTLVLVHDCILARTRTVTWFMWHCASPLRLSEIRGFPRSTLSVPALGAFSL